MTIPGAFRRVVDPRFGIVRRVARLPVPSPLPSSLVRVEALVSDSRRFSAWHADDRAAGYAWFDQPGGPAASIGAATGAALGESIERYCGNLVGGDSTRSGWRALAARGVRALDPDRLALFSEVQYAAPGFPFVPFDRDLEVLWTRGRSLVDGDAVQVPASLVWVTFFRDGPGRAEPQTHATPYAGIAAGSTPEQAIRGALLELAERDAVSLSWHRGDPLTRLASPTWLRNLAADGDLSFSAFLFPSDLEIPVIGVLAEDRRKDHLALGLAARPRADEALRKAAAEACHLLLTAGILDDPESAFMRDVARGAPGIGVKPWRADRAYRADYRDDWRDVWDLLSQLQLYLDPAMRDALDARLAESPVGASETRTIDAIPSVEGTCDALVARFAAKGFAPVAVDVTTSDVRPTGLSVMRVVAPGLYGNAPAAYPYLGGARMASKATTAGGDGCRLPLPYA